MSLASFASFASLASFVILGRIGRSGEPGPGAGAVSFDSSEFFNSSGVGPGVSIAIYR